MKNLVYLFVGAILCTITACKDAKKGTEKEGPTQMEQVMATHDEVMPKMSAINRLITELEAKIDTTEQGLAYEKAANDLKDANKSMMDWMQGFGNRFDSDEIMKGKELNEEKQLWLDEEAKKVNEVKKKINGSIERAETLLKE